MANSQSSIAKPVRTLEYGRLVTAAATNEREKSEIRDLISHRLLPGQRLVLVSYQPVEIEGDDVRSL